MQRANQVRFQPYSNIMMMSLTLRDFQDLVQAKAREAQAAAARAQAEANPAVTANEAEAASQAEKAEAAPKIPKTRPNENKVVKNQRPPRAGQTERLRSLRSAQNQQLESPDGV
jgi:hypothetical protein